MAFRMRTPVLVIGAGLAGCVTALRLADHGVDVTLLASGAEAENANSWLAQGGVIFRSKDSADANALAKDVMIAGRQHNNASAVQFLAQEGPGAVEDMLMQRVGVPFDKRGTSASAPEGEWDLTREGGHSTQRIVHCADHTGHTIMENLIRTVEAHPRIAFLRGYTAVDLLTSHHHTRGMTYRYQLENRCCGAYVLCEATNEVQCMLADMTVLATGGVGQVYLHTTNAASATGSGIAMASRAFVRLENLEFVQFHPTTLFHMEPRRFLITEAMRGEGAVLVNAKGERFMQRYDARGELAPRDIVAQSIVTEILENGEQCVFLDARSVPHNLTDRFPTVFQACLDRGIDIRRQPIPVVPAAHYFCGGILTDERGRTSLQGLYSVGECSCTGVHGANRLASTSLLEAVLWGRNAGDDIYSRMQGGLPDMQALHAAIVDWESTGDENNDDPALIAQDWATIRHTMWNYVGITRTQTRLARAFEDLRDLSRRLHAFYRSTPPSKDIIDLFHGCQTAYLITQSALRNRESLGCHNRV
ncbi:L-aspartate oxidase [Desulfovibrio cuneatus]|uniref:L-aspartate oxidase n=1 Tax=Desulfovibrio cuneatus TaxID=159728 RepID=UPI000410E22D|nr:L-aspartate oxidase [Desulfovibrio cuneatus]